MTLAHKLLHNYDLIITQGQYSSQHEHNFGGLPQQGCRFTEKDNQAINIIRNPSSEFPTSSYPNYPKTDLLALRPI